jgi:SAM-dependent methyltransferase
MRIDCLPIEAVLAAYDVVSRLYPYVPPLSLWRSWEYAAYQRFSLPEPVLDVGCGDGQFFRLVWPHVREAVGVDIDPRVAEAARASGVYREVHVGPAHALPFPDESFAAAFANCSLEHMDHLPEVLRSVARCLRPGAPFLLSVVTDKLVEWATLPLLVETVGEPQRARSLQAEYEAFHHLVNPLPPEGWVRALEAAGFEVDVYIPIVPEMTSRLFLLLDHLWHVRRPPGEVGDVLYARLRQIPHFPQAFRQVLLGFLQMERDLSVGSGAVFYARRRP